ncbi:ribose-phosphate pyrophosphokinase-like domain-containing protein [Candidatus Vidania fulgoroideorum]
MIFLNKKLYKKINIKNKVLVKKKNFNNSEIFIKIKKKIKKKINIFFDISKNINNKIIELLMLLYIFIEKKIRIQIFFTYLPYCRQDRKQKNSCVSFLFFLFLLKSFNVYKIITIDLHTTSYFNNYGIKIKNLNTQNIIKKIIKSKIKKKITLVYTDIGCFKRYFDLSKIFDFIIFNKKRVNGKIKKVNLLFKKKIKKNILIIDDIIDSGNTIFKIQNKILKNFFVKNIYVYITHFLMSYKKYKTKIINNKFIKKFFTVDFLCNKNLKKMVKIKIKNFFTND